MVKTQALIESKLTQRLAPQHLEVINESHHHNVPKGSETHFKVVAVASEFEKKTLLERHRCIYEILSEELKTKKIHALTLSVFSPEEWRKSKFVQSSPPCEGGSKHG